MLLMKKKYLCAFMEECLHKMEKGYDLVGEVEKVKKLKNSKEMCMLYIVVIDKYFQWVESKGQ